jgi:AraC-like DNA-binding protein
MITHLSEVIKVHCNEILTRQDVKTMVENIKKTNPTIVEDLIPNIVSYGYLQKVLSMLLREGVPMCADATAKTVPPDILNALAFMDDHLTENITVKDVAYHVNQSINTLERRFKKNLAISPTKILLRKRLLLSQDFLRNGDSVTDAAIKCGIPDYSNYIQLFKKQFKMTPLHFKRQYKDYLTDANSEIRNFATLE